MRALLGLLLLLAAALPGRAAEVLARDDLAARIVPPYALGEPVDPRGIWTILNSGGEPAGWVFQTAPLAPLPGFSGAPIDMLVTIDRDGRFLDVVLLAHNEPIFVSGLGEAPFHAFVGQYRGHSLNDTITVGVPYGEGSRATSHVYLDGVTKATASVRIAHESILAAALSVVREKVQGIAAGPPAAPDPAHDEPLTWADLVAQGIATRRLVTNAEIQAAFAGTLWAEDDPVALEDPQGTYLDLWIVDLGPPAIARAVLAPESAARLARFLALSPHDEPVLLIDAGRHGLTGPDFVRNTAPDLVSAAQGGLPVQFRDSDLELEFAEGVPEGAALVLRADRRLGFDPSRPFEVSLRAVREHGSFMPEIGTVDLSATHATPERFFLKPPAPPPPAPPWAAALRDRQADLLVLGTGLAALGGLLLLGQSWLAGLARFTPLRLALLAAMTGFVGFWGQGQLSIVTVLGVIRAGLDGGSFLFLLYDPFSLLLWGVVLLSFLLWGRGFFCGWLCPFGALQEFAHHAGRRLGLRQIRVPERWDRRLKGLKYVVLASLVAAALLSPPLADALVEVEPFKTAITTYFWRDWWFAAYAAFWLLLGLVLFKGFCRYVCPLGAVMAIGGMLRGRDWIARRAECGSPCQLCRVRCKYQAIRPDGRIAYQECFQCLDCVTIHDSPKLCVPLVLAARKGRPA